MAEAQNRYSEAVKKAMGAKAGSGGQKAEASAGRSEGAPLAIQLPPAESGPNAARKGK